jgi:hypothetical protein
VDFAETSIFGIKGDSFCDEGLELGYDEHRPRLTCQPACGTKDSLPCDASAFFFLQQLAAEELKYLQGG